MRQHTHLLAQLVRRDLAARYRGSFLGVVWVLLTPLLLLGVYSFVFGVVFEAKWGVEINGREVPFPIMLFSGLILHGLLADILPRVVGLMRAHPNYIKKVVFPIQILPVMAVISSGVLFAIQLGLLMLACAYYAIWPDWSWLWLVPVLLAYALMLLGLSWGLAALGVFLPDLQHIMGLLVTLLLFLSPVFYSIDMLPAMWQQLIMLNPLSWIISCVRDVMFYQQAPNATQLMLLWGVSLVVLLMGYLFFNKAAKSFADVI